MNDVGNFAFGWIPIIERDYSIVDAQNPLKLSWHANKGNLYTVIFWDQDAPYPIDPKFSPFLHYLVINIPNNDITQGTKLMKYQPPSPPYDSAPHRYHIGIFKQDGKISPVKITNRDKFDVEDFIVDYELSPVATVEFRIDPNITENINRGNKTSPHRQISPSRLSNKVMQRGRPARSPTRDHRTRSPVRDHRTGSPVRDHGTEYQRKKSPARKSPTRRSPVRKSPTRRSPTRKSPTRRSPARKSPVRRSPARRSPTRRSPTRKSPARRSPRRIGYSPSGRYREAGREDYFKEDSGLNEKQKKFCRCTVHVGAKQEKSCTKAKQGTSKSCVNPYAVCAKTTGTSSRKCGEVFEFKNFPKQELVSYARAHDIRVPAKARKQEILDAIEEWKSRE
jgi:hypothetical protein